MAWSTLYHQATPWLLAVEDHECTLEDQGKALEFSTLPAYASPRRCSPYTHQSPHPNSPSSPEPLKSLPFPSLHILPNFSNFHGSYTHCALHRFCLRTSFALLVDDGVHGSKHTTIRSNFNNCLHFLPFAGGAGNIHLASPKNSLDWKLDHELKRLPNKCCNRVHIRI